MQNTRDCLLTISETIYKEIYCRFVNRYIVVFLCGGASTKKKLSLRDKTRRNLEKANEKGGSAQYLIFYPEDLLLDILNKTKEDDLLHYERFLADNSHVIVVICESPGSLVELGAFTNNEYTVEKVIAAVDKKHSKDKSFIMLGPIKYLMKRQKSNVIYYGGDEEEFSERLSRQIKEKWKDNSSNRMSLEINKIVGMHYFIQLVLYFYKKLNWKQIDEMTRHVISSNEIACSNYSILINASIRLLFQEKKITKVIIDSSSYYMLTRNGIVSIRSMASVKFL